MLRKSLSWPLFALNRIRNFREDPARGGHYRDRNSGMPAFAANTLRSFHTIAVSPAHSKTQLLVKANCRRIGFQDIEAVHTTCCANRLLETLNQSRADTIPCRMCGYGDRYQAEFFARRGPDERQEPRSDQLDRRTKPQQPEMGSARRRQCTTGRADERKTVCNSASPATIPPGRIRPPRRHSNARGRSTGRGTPRKVPRSMLGKVAPRACPAGRTAICGSPRPARCLLSCKDELPSAVSPPLLLKRTLSDFRTVLESGCETFSGIAVGIRTHA